MGRRIIELSMEVFKGMVVYPSVTPPFISQVYSHEEFAEITGTSEFGITHCNTGTILMGDHVGTPIDSRRHANPDAPVDYMFNRKKFWEAHRVMREREYYHIENLINLDQIPVPYGFVVSAFPIKLRGATASPIRAVAIIEE